MIIRLVNNGINYVPRSKCFTYSMYVILTQSYGEVPISIYFNLFTRNLGTKSLTDLPKVTK